MHWSSPPFVADVSTNRIQRINQGDSAHAHTHFHVSASPGSNARIESVKGFGKGYNVASSSNEPVSYKRW